ncbi:MAG: ABC transporter substrate-binding protein [Campylobacterales bacterium]
MRLLILTFLLTSSLFAKTYSDMIGREVEIESTPQSFVAFGPGALRLMVYLGLEDRAVGIERGEQRGIPISPYRVALGGEYIKALPIIGQGGPGKVPNLEAIIKLKPDVIVASFVDRKVADMISSKTGIPVFVASYGSGYGGQGDKFSDITKSLIALGEIFGVKQRAIDIDRALKKEQAKLLKLLKQKPSAYIGGIGYKGAQGFSSTEGDYISFELLGLKNSVIDKQGHHFLQKEAILKTNPKYIFIDRMGQGIYKDELKNDGDFFAMLDAYKNSRVYLLPPYNFYNTNLENTVVNSYIIASIIEDREFPQEDVRRVLEVFYPTKHEKVYESIRSIVK